MEAGTSGSQQLLKENQTLRANTDNLGLFTSPSILNVHKE
jgi:hypothetical protein